MQKLLRLLMLMSGNRRYTMEELMDRCNQSDRTIELLEGSSPIKNRLAVKLNSLYNFRALGQIPEKASHEAVHELGEAIRQRKRVLLRAYRSSNSDTISDRTVEPFEFLGDYSGVWCYDVADKVAKHFKIARIAAVEVLEAEAVNQSHHILPFTDAFRMSAPKAKTTVQAQLTLKAYNLLMEEYPLAEVHLKAVNGHYMLEIPVADYNGIGRFVLGLLGDMRVLGPVDFIDFLKEKRKCGDKWGNGK